MSKTALGDRMKAYERSFTSQKAMPLVPIIARLDGKAFHSFCKGFDKPFDLDFVNVMERTTKALVKETSAIIGYTQSDEITLIFYTDKPKSQVPFDGKIYKMISILASLTTARFNFFLKDQIKYAVNNVKKTLLLARKPAALFDCRVFQVPTKEEAVNCLIWREQDATRNSILNTGQAHFSTRELYGKNVKEIQEMLFQKKGINWSVDTPDNLKRGSYFRRNLIERKLTAEEIINLPAKHEAKQNPNILVKRHKINRVDMPILSKVSNRVEVIFEGAEPICFEE